MRTGDFTAAEVMAQTALTRTTVLGVCDDLVALGWLEEIADSRAAGLTSKGRPARRYRLRDTAGLLLAMDAGEHRITARLTDLRGETLVERSLDLRPPLLDGRQRLATASRLLDDVFAAAEVTPDAVLVAVVGVPAPVLPDGTSSPGDDGFWGAMNPGFHGLLDARVVVENDANLAAVAEQAQAPADQPGASATVLSGERLGAGIILDGRLVRGARGGVGEMRFLDIVDGVGDASGIAAVARTWAREALESGTTDSTLSALDPSTVTAEDVFAAAREGDAFALDLIDRLGRRLARVASVLASLLDLETVVVAGAIADAIEPVLARARAELAAHAARPIPSLRASTLGQTVVVQGALQLGLELVQRDPLSFALPSGPGLASIP